MTVAAKFCMPLTGTLALAGDTVTEAGCDDGGGAL
jgi:hypothetical protein